MLYQIEEFPEAWADACLRDSEGRLMFLSLYGRSGSLMQFMAAMQLGAAEKGAVRSFYLVAAAERHRVDVGDPKRLTKRAGKLPAQNLFGAMSTLWVFDADLQAPDRANRIGWVLCHTPGAPEGSENELEDRVWQIVKQLSPVALQEHWREPVLAWCAGKEAVAQMGGNIYRPIGPVKGARVSLSDHFTAFVSEGVRERALTLA